MVLWLLRLYKTSHILNKWWFEPFSLSSPMELSWMGRWSSPGKNPPGPDVAIKEREEAGCSAWLTFGRSCWGIWPSAADRGAQRGGGGQRRELGSGSPPWTFRVSSAALSLPGGPGRVSVRRLAPVPKLGRLVTHEGTAADRLEPLLLESVPSCSAASSSRRPGAADRLPRCSGFTFPHSWPLHTAPHLSFFVLPYLFLRRVFSSLISCCPSLLLTSFPVQALKAFLPFTLCGHTWPCGILACTHTHIQVHVY